MFNWFQSNQFCMTVLLHMLVCLVTVAHTGRIGTIIQGLVLSLMLSCSWILVFHSRIKRSKILHLAWSKILFDTCNYNVHSYKIFQSIIWLLVYSRLKMSNLLELKISAAISAKTRPKPQRDSSLFPRVG